VNWKEEYQKLQRDNLRLSSCVRDLEAYVRDVELAAAAYARRVHLRDLR
jgi:hypothetical protein